MKEDSITLLVQALKKVDLFEISEIKKIVEYIII